MRSSKGSRKIVVANMEYRWRAAGNDGYIVIGIWPTNNIGPYIQGNFRYHETWGMEDEKCLRSAGGQIVVTNKLIRRIIEHAIKDHQYDPNSKGKELNLKMLDESIKWNDAIRARKTNGN